MWAQPWAWLGLIGIAAPIAVHMLARHQSVRTLFPSLRFIDLADVTFIKRQRLTDIPLLLVRLAIVIAAVAAIAGPRLPLQSSGPGNAAVAVVVDISAGAPRDEAQAAARAAVANVASSTIVETESLRAGIVAASEWLMRQSGDRQLVVVSDFPRGAVDAAAMNAVPAGVGVRLTALPLIAAKSPAGFELRGDRSRMAWAAQPSSSASLPIDVKAGADQPSADAMVAAVASLINTTPVDANARHATLVFPSAPERAALQSAAPINQPWMFDVARPLLSSGAEFRASGNELMLLMPQAPATAVSAHIASSVLESLVQPLALSEFEPEAISADMLRGWERAPSSAPGAFSGEPQGRWLWLVVLALMGIEMWMRRRAVAAAAAAPEVHARVA